MKGVIHMKKRNSIISIILAFVLVFSLTGCNEEKKAETAVNEMFAAFKNLDYEAAQNFVNIDDITARIKNTKTEFINENMTLVMNNVFKKLEYEIISSEKTDSNNVIVKTKITAVNMVPILTDYFTKYSQYMRSFLYSYQLPSVEDMDKETERILDEITLDPNLETVTNEADIKVIKNENNKWEIEADDTFVNALFGDLINAVRALNS